MGASIRLVCTGGGGTTLVGMGAVGIEVRGINSGTGALSDSEVSEEKLDSDDEPANAVLFCCCE